MTDYIDRCLDEGFLSPSEYSDLIDDGDDDFPSDPETCVHEAGHAVMGYLQGRRIKHVYAGPFYDAVWGDLAGQVAYEDDDHSYPTDGDDVAKAQWLKVEMLSTMGAGVAVCRFNGGGEPANELGDTDQSAIYGNWLLDYCGYAGTFADCPFDIPDEPTEAQEELWWEWTEEREYEAEKALWAEVEQMIGENWHLVEGLAAVLFVNPFLDGPEVYEVFDRIQTRHAASK